MKFNNESDEEVCGKTTDFNGMAVICLRTKNHHGGHQAIAWKAGLDDGVNWCCRTGLSQPHADWCINTKQNND